MRLSALLSVFALMPPGHCLAGTLSGQAFDTLIRAFLGLIGLKRVIGL